MPNLGEQSDFNQLLAQYGENLPSHVRTPWQAGQEQAISGKMIHSVAALVEGSKVSHLTKSLAGQSLFELKSLGRQGVLERLKSLDVKLSDRQAFANLLAKAERERLLPSAELVAASATSKCVLPSGCRSIDELAVPQGKGVRIFAISDIHTDHPANMKWIRDRMYLPERTPEHFDVLLCPGDVSDKVAVRDEAFKVRRAFVEWAVGRNDVHECIGVGRWWWRHMCLATLTSDLEHLTT